MKRQTILTGVLGVSVVIAACGSQDATSTDTIVAVSATPVETMTPVDTTIEPAAPETTAPETTAARDAGDPAAAAASAAWSLVFLIQRCRSTTRRLNSLRPRRCVRRSRHIRRPAAGGGFGGITLEPTAVEVEGDLATITYDVNFGADPAYGDQTGTRALVDGVWTVSSDEFCSFMASARVSCP